MRVPLLDLRQQYRALAQPLRAEFDEILASQSFILGPKVAAFEEAIGRYLGSPHAIGVSSGTDALLAILMASGIGCGDAVITTAYTFFATAGCIARVGATPVFVDIDPVTYNLSPRALERYLIAEASLGEDGTVRTSSGHTVRAIVPVHLFGLCCEMEELHRISEKFRLDVIEDAAQGIGAECPFFGRSAKAGTMGESGYFSFYPSKNLGAAGDAGMVVCRDAAFAERLRICRQHGMEPRYFHQFVGGNFRLDELQAAILAVKFPFLDGWSAARRAVADFYREEFQRRGLAQHIELPAEPFRAGGLTNHHTYHQYVIRTSRRDDLQRHLTEREIGTAIYYPLGLHEQECFAHLGYEKGDLPETERAARETLALPMFPELGREEQLFVMDAIEAFFLKPRDRG